MLNIGPQELLIILVIALLVVGPQRLPELGRSIGRGLRELRKAQDEVRRTIQVNLDEPNGDGGVAPRRPSGSGSSPAGDGGVAPRRPRGSGSSPAGAVGSSDVQDPTPTVGDAPTADEVREISRSLGRSLGQLRRAREEVQRSFRVDAPAPKPPTPADPAPKPSTTTEPPPAARGEAPVASDAEPVSDDPARG